MRTQLIDFSMAYEDSGSGTPLILVHGYPLNRTLWRGQVKGLSGIARVIAPDLRGHGESKNTPGSFSMQLLAKDIWELIQNLGIKEPVVLCGLSMGGYICFEFYRNYPKMVKGMILTATKSTADSIEAKAKRDEAAELARDQGPLAIAAAMLPKMMAPATYQAQPNLVEQVRKMMENISTQTIVGDLKAMKNREDSTSLLDKMDIPVLILHGMDDQIIPMTEVDTMKNRIKTSTLVLIPEAGHLLNLEQPNRFNQAVKEFMQSL